MNSTQMQLGFATSVTGLIATVTSVYNQTFWGIVSGAAVGVGGVAWIVGFMIRDKTFQFLKQQNEELSVELDKAARFALEAKHEVVRVAEILALKTAEDVNLIAGIHDKGMENQQTIEKLIKALESRLDRVVSERDNLIERNNKMFALLEECNQEVKDLIAKSK